MVNLTASEKGERQKKPPRRDGWHRGGTKEKTEPSGNGSDVYIIGNVAEELEQKKFVISQYDQPLRIHHESFKKYETQKWSRRCSISNANQYFRWLHVWTETASPMEFHEAYHRKRNPLSERNPSFIHSIGENIQCTVITNPPPKFRTVYFRQIKGMWAASGGLRSLWCLSPAGSFPWLS